MKNIAPELGFDAIGVAPADILRGDGEHLRKWVGEGKNAGMGYMANNIDKRENPALLVDGAHSVIVTLTNYYSGNLQSETVPKLAKYAWGKDYHIVVKERLKRLLEFLQQYEPGLSGRCFVDSAPVFEHEWARRAGLGWIGKNTLLLNREIGSFCFIGVIILNAEFKDYSKPFTRTFCGNCNRCVEACPTGALTPYEVDARLCISYQTIENKGDYPDYLKEKADGRIFGCDACQDVCPWNSRARQHTVPDFIPDAGQLELGFNDWLQMNSAQFGKLFKDTPLERTGLRKIQRNLFLKNIDRIE